MQMQKQVSPVEPMWEDRQCKRVGDGEGPVAGISDVASNTHSQDERTLRMRTLWDGTQNLRR